MDWKLQTGPGLVFKDTSWIEILHAKAKSHSTFWHRRTVSPSLMEKNPTWYVWYSLKGVQFIEEKRWSLYQKIILTIIMRRRLQGKNYRILKNKKIVTVFSMCFFDAEQHVISSFQLNKTFSLVVFLILVNYYW